MWPFYNMFHSSWGKNPEDSPDVFGDQSIFQVICRSIASKQKDLATRLVCCFGCGKNSENQLKSQIFLNSQVACSEFPANGVKSKGGNHVESQLSESE